MYTLYTQANDIPGFISDNPGVNRIVFAATAANFFVKPAHFKPWLKTGTHTSSGRLSVRFVVADSSPLTDKTFGKHAAVSTLSRVAINQLLAKNKAEAEAEAEARVVELVVMPSTSPAAATLRLVSSVRCFLWRRASAMLASYFVLAKLFLHRQLYLGLGVGWWVLGDPTFWPFWGLLVEGIFEWGGGIWGDILTVLACRVKNFLWPHIPPQYNDPF